MGELQPGKIEVYHDIIAEKLDEMADICEYWKKKRNIGRTPNSIRSALLMIAEEIVLLKDCKHFNKRG